MATATTQKDDDILIISDDTTSSETTDDITFSFDVEDDISATKEEVATPSSGNIQKREENPVKSENVSEDKEIKSQDNSATSEMDFSLDLYAPSEEAKTEDTVLAQETEEAPKKEEDFSLGIDTSEDSSPEQDDTASSDESLNDILAGTVTKLEARKDAIAIDTAAKTSEEKTIKGKIKALEDEYATLEAEIKTLNAEAEKITANIAELEKMKLDPVKEHNAKRVVKK